MATAAKLGTVLIKARISVSLKMALDRSVPKTPLPAGPQVLDTTRVENAVSGARKRTVFASWKEPDAPTLADLE